MIKGKVTKLVKTYGSTWGFVRPDSEPRQVFFNLTSLVDPSDFDSLNEGDAVEFDQRPDRANGMHAVNMSRLPAPARDSAPVAATQAAAG